LRPRGIDPYNFAHENYSRELWIAEGMTSYYADIIGVRSGFVPVSEYVDRLANTVSADRQRPGNALQPVSEASFDAWIGGTSHYYNSESDIYQRGAAVSLLLDLTIRNATADSVSLDSVLREMLRRYPLAGGGYTLADFERVISGLTRQDFSSFFNDYITGAKPLQWEEGLAGAGISVQCTDTVDKPWAGISTYDAGNSIRIAGVNTGSPAAVAGLGGNDEVLALNGFRVRSSTLGDRIADQHPGDTVTFTIFRNDKLRTIPVVLGKAPRTDYKTAKVNNPTPLQKAIFESWLSTTWGDGTKQ